MIREFVLQLKRGSVKPAYFAEKYGVDVRDRFRDPLDSLEADGYLAARTADRIAITRDGLLRVDVLLQRFFLPQHAGIRYT
jgi:oxygen-independent coproporphyrinogen-3 oxidase